MSRNPYENLPSAPSFEVTSTDVQDGEEFPVPYTGTTWDQICQIETFVSDLDRFNRFFVEKVSPNDVE